jgi:hypothetical protein
MTLFTFQTFEGDPENGGGKITRQLEAATLKQALIDFANASLEGFRASTPDLVLIGSMPVWSWQADDYDVISTDFAPGIPASLRQKPRWSAVDVAQYFLDTPECGAEWLHGSVAICAIHHVRASILAWTTARALLHCQEIGVVEKPLSKKPLSMWWAPNQLSGHQRLALNLTPRLDALQARDAAIRGSA